MNKKILESILENKERFIPLIFTRRQINVIKKYNENKKLSNAQKKALYTSIKKKMDALGIFAKGTQAKEYYISGSAEMLPERLENAKKLLDDYSKDYTKVFIAGSFLFSKTYNDIDIFIIKERGYKEQWNNNRHIIFLTEKKLFNPIFQSASLISISNFQIPIKINQKNPFLSELMSTYHEAIIENMRDDKPEALRRLIFDYCLLCKNQLLNAKELKEFTEELTIDGIDSLLKELCKKLFSRSYLYVDLHNYIKTLDKSIKNIHPNKHLIRFRKTYEEIIYGSERNKIEVA